MSKCGCKHDEHFHKPCCTVDGCMCMCFVQDDASIRKSETYRGLVRMWDKFSSKTNLNAWQIGEAFILFHEEMDSRNLYRSRKQADFALKATRLIINERTRP